MISTEEKLYRQKFKETTEKRKIRRKKLNREYSKEQLLNMAKSYSRVSGLTMQDSKSELVLIILDNEYPYSSVDRNKFYESLPKYLTG